MTDATRADAIAGWLLESGKVTAPLEALDESPQGIRLEGPAGPGLSPPHCRTQTGERIVGQTLDLQQPSQPTTAMESHQVR
jgi:hypothetical protein